MSKFCAFSIFVIAVLLPSWSSASVAPDSGPIGTTVTITGAGFGKFVSTKDNVVLFGKAPGLVEHWDNDRVVARVPAKAVTGHISVRNGKKTQKAGTFTVELPLVKEVSPEAASPGQTVQIIGRNFGQTMGQKDSEMLFGVNEVLFNGIPAVVVRWRDSRIEVKVPSNATSGSLVVRLSSVDPLPDGSCCAPVEYSASKPVQFTVISTILMEPTEGPLGNPVVISGMGFGQWKPGVDTVLFNGIQAPILEWANTRIRVTVPLKGTTGPVSLRKGAETRVIGEFRVTPHKATGIHPETAPIGTLITISGESFGIFSDSGPNQVLFGGVPARVFRWSDRSIDAWVPLSAKSGPVVVRRGAGEAKADGSCCEARGVADAEAGVFTLVVPKVTAITPATGVVDSIVTITGSGFGDFIKNDERTQDHVSREGHLHKFQKLSENIARTAVLFTAREDFVKSSHVAGIVESWTDTEIRVQVPRVAAPGMVVIRRGSWDMLPDGACCQDKQWVETEAGTFTPTGLDDIDQKFRKLVPGYGGGGTF